MAAALACLVVVLFVGLLPLGHWYSDEYDIFHDMALHGAGAAWHRFWAWSPRPVSEGLIYLYGRLVLATGQTWMFWVLLAPLLLLLAAAVWPLYRAPQRAARGWITLTLTVSALCLAGHPVARVFYWPVASLAYVVTLAGVLGVLAENLRGAAYRDRVCGAWLLLAALSSEIGAMFALAYGLPSLLWQGRRARALLPGVGGAALVLVLIMSHRAGGISEQMAGGGPVHDLLASLYFSMRASWSNIWFSSQSGSQRDIILQVLSKLALVAGAAGLAAGRGYPPVRRQGLVILALAAASMVPATLFAAYYQFGQLCCAHHDTVRQCFVAVAMAALGVTLASCWPARVAGERWQRIAPWLLPASLLLALAVSAGPLWSDYREWRTRHGLQQANWRSGEAAAARLWVRQLPPARLSGGPLPLPAGRFGAGVAVPAAVDHQLRFFGKSQVQVEPPEPALRP